MTKISIRQLSIIIAVIFSVTKFYVLPAHVSSFSNEAGWSALFINFIVDLLLLLLCLFVINNQPDSSVYDTSVRLFGKTFTKIVFFIYAVYFLLKSFIPILEQKNTISLTFYESQPTLLIFMPYFVVGFYVILKGVNAFARSVEIISILWISGLIITLSLAIPAGEYASLLPIIQPAKKVLSGTLNSFLWFGDPLMILFISEFLSDKKGLYKKTLIGYAVGALATLVLVAVFYSVFQGIAERQYYAPIKMSKYSITLSNIGRLDYFGSLMFSVVSVYAMTFPMLIATLCINKVFNLKNNVFVPLGVTISELILVYILQNEIFANISFFQTYILPFMLVACYALPLILFFGVIINKRKFRLKGAENV